LISKQEVMDFAREFSLRPDIIEKDYVLGWLLSGIYHYKPFRSSWIFKGGTCLKKCFFETYRFSEDLDFTLADPSHLDSLLLAKAFTEITNWIYEQSGIEFPLEDRRFDVYQNPRGNISANGRIGYRGPLRPGGGLPRIRLDLTNDEILIFDPIVREVHHPYSDKAEDLFFITSYSYEELFAEKIRALAERERPRDLYDVVYLYRQDGVRPDIILLLDSLKKKCEFKGIDTPTMDILESKPERTELISEWSNMLAHQLPTLPPFESFWNDIPEVFNWLYKTKTKTTKESIPTRAVFDNTWKPPSMATAWGVNTPIEVIRFAAVNHLCVNLGYKRSHRLIEPYSLRRTKDGNILLHAVKHDTGEARSYRLIKLKVLKLQMCHLSQDIPLS
jgi:predicted nucleotidyltransferase component of viral defense system